MSKSPVAILYDSSGNPVGVVQDGSVYRLQADSSVSKWMGSSAPTVGQKGMSSCLPVAIANDQSNVRSYYDNVLSVSNSTATPLGAGASFTGTSEEVKDYASITCAVFADKDSAENGFVAEYSTDGTNWDLQDYYSIYANQGIALTFDPVARFFRVRYTNNVSEAQGSFRLQTVFHRVCLKPVRRRLADDLDDQISTEVVRSIMTGRLATDTSYGNVRTDSAGNLFVISTASSADPLMINLRYYGSVGALVANSFRSVVEWAVPTGYFGYLVRFTSWQAEAAVSRLTVVKFMGELNVGTNVYTPGEVYTEPQWSSIVEAEVTTAIGSASDLTITVTYTNENGVTGRTGYIYITKSSIVGTRSPLVRQGNDLGVRSIQNLSSSPTTSGAVQVLGHLQLMIHDDLSTTISLETIVGAGAITFPTETRIHLEFSGGTVSKQRRLDALLQLVPE